MVHMYMCTRKCVLKNGMQQHLWLLGYACLNTSIFSGCVTCTCTCIWDSVQQNRARRGYNFITIKIARCTKQHIFATVLPFPFKFHTPVPTPFLCVKIDFCDLHIFRAVDTTIVNPAG